MTTNATFKATTFDAAQFEKNATVQNGQSYWWFSDLAKVLGMETSGLAIALGMQKEDEFRDPLLRAQQLCKALDLSLEEHCVIASHPIDTNREDILLSRFGCFLIVLAAVTASEAARAATQYFCGLIDHIFDEDILVQQTTRLLKREQISDAEKSLTSVMTQFGVTDYADVRNAGYLGLYKMRAANIRKARALDAHDTAFDFMDSEELTVNLYRLEQTEIAIVRETLHGQQRLEKLAYHVGRLVRGLLRSLTGKFAEEYPVIDDISGLRTQFRKIAREFAKLDGE